MHHWSPSALVRSKGAPSEPLGCTTQIHSRTEWDHWDAPLSALNRRAEWDHWDAPLSRAPFMSVVQRGSRRPPRTWAVSDSVLLSHRVEPHRCLLNLSEYPHQRAGRRTPTIHMADASDEYQQQQREKQNTGEKGIGIRWRQQCSSLSGTFMICSGGGCRVHDFLALLSLGQGQGGKEEQGENTGKSKQQASGGTSSTNYDLICDTITILR